LRRALALALEVAGVDQLSDDQVRSPFGDADLPADLAQPDTWVVSDAKQHLAVIAEEGPVGHMGRAGLTVDVYF
jgi:hypothetical protein